MGRCGELAMWGQTRSMVVSIFLLAVTLWAATAGTAHAYIDAGTGSLILQVLLAGLFGSLFALKVFWRRVKGMSSRLLMKLRSRETSQL